MSTQTLVDLFEESVRDRPRADLFQWKQEGAWVRMSSQDAHRAVQEAESEMQAEVVLVALARAAFHVPR